MHSNKKIQLDIIQHLWIWGLQFPRYYSSWIFCAIPNISSAYKCVYSTLTSTPTCGLSPVLTHGWSFSTSNWAIRVYIFSSLPFMIKLCNLAYHKLTRFNKLILILFEIQFHKSIQKSHEFHYVNLNDIWMYSISQILKWKRHCFWMAYVNVYVLYIKIT